MNKEEQLLEKMGEELDHVSIPDALDKAVEAGLNKGKRTIKHQLRLKWLRVFTIAAAIVILFTLSVRVSPAFARTVFDIPGFSQLVNLIRGDQSLEEALTNKYVQPLYLSQTHGSTTVTLEYMISDENRMVIFYKVHFADGSKKNFINAPDLYNDKGKPLPAGISYDITNKDKADHLQKIDVQFSNLEDTQFTNPLILKMKSNGDTWTFHIPYDIRKMKADKRVYNVNKTVSIEGQKLTFNKITVYPTGAAVEVNFDPNNTKLITHFDDLRLVDDQGRVFAGVKNGAIAMGDVTEGHQELFLDSDYFEDPKSLRLELSTVRYVDKNDQNIVLNLQTGKVIKAPKGNVWKLKGAHQDSKKWIVDYFVTLPSKDRNNEYQIISWDYKDASGKSYSFSSQGTLEDLDSKHSYMIHQQLYLPKLPYKEPLTFKIIDYPTRLHGNVSIKIK